MTGPRTSTNDAAKPRAADGRVAGRRGQETRLRLLEATRAAIAEQAYRDLTVVEITRRAQTSPATFYQYFPDVEAAVLTLLGDLVDSAGAELRRLVTKQTDDREALSRNLAEGFLTFFQQHGDLLRVVDLVVLEGDERFRHLRTGLFNGVFLALQDLAHEARSAGHLAPDASPAGIAGVLTTMLTQVSSHQGGYLPWGVSSEHLVQSMTTVIVSVLGD